MLLTLTCEAERATDLGYLLFKNPASAISAEVSCGRAYVFYPEASDSRCTVALLLDVDPIALVRGPHAGLDQYVNDRPYVASSLMSVAIGTLFGTALTGRSRERPERVDEAMPLEATVAAVSCSGGETLVHRLFEPLGYEVLISRSDADGPASVFGFTIRGKRTVRDLLSHLYVLLPVLDNAKHYFVDETEVDKLLRKGEGWLADHPEKDLIVERYLVRRRGYIRTALEALRDEDVPDEAAQASPETTVEEPIRLNDLRIDAIVEAVRAGSPRRVIDLGCGEGRLIGRLIEKTDIPEVVGMDVSPTVLERAERSVARLPERRRQRVKLSQGSLLYRDDRMAGFDVAVLSEVIEHIDAPRLREMEQVVFGIARPGRVIVTTPNREYNAMWPALAAGKSRHRDHRFEWTRAEFRQWCTMVAEGNGYRVEHQGIGPEDAALGTPTQMALFDRV